MKKKTNKGMQGDWIEIQPEKVESMLSIDQLIQKGKVVGAGPKSKCNEGDIVIIRDWLVERVRIGDDIMYFTTDENVIKII